MPPRDVRVHSLKLLPRHEHDRLPPPLLRPRRPLQQELLQDELPLVELLRLVPLQVEQPLALMPQVKLPLAALLPLIVLQDDHHLAKEYQLQDHPEGVLSNPHPRFIALLHS